MTPFLSPNRSSFFSIMISQSNKHSMSSVNEMHIKSMRCKIICFSPLIFIVPFSVSFTKKVKSIESFCLHSQEVVKFLSIQLFSYDIIKIIRKNWNIKKKQTKKHAVKSIQKQPQRMAKPRKFPLQPKLFFSFSFSHSFYFINIITHENEYEEWREEKKCNSNFGTKKSIFMSSYIFYETAVCCSWLFCCRCK